METEWRVLVADERSITRRALVYLVRSILPNVDVVEGGCPDEILGALGGADIDLVLVDAVAPGLGIVAQVRTRSPHTKVIVMTGYDQPDEALRAIRGGAHGYLMRGIHPEEFGRCLQAIMETDVMVFSAALAAALGEAQVQPQGPTPVEPIRLVRPEPPPFRPADTLMESLSRREREIFELMAQNLSNKEIAAQLLISEQTVKAHVSRILVKLGQPNRAKAVIHAVRTGYQEASRLR